MNTVRKKGEGGRRERLQCFVARRAYVPSTSESKDEGWREVGREGGARGRMGG